jgi:putative peptide zinc metalloprotease protein
MRNHRLLLLLLALVALAGPGVARAENDTAANGDTLPITLPDSANQAVAYNTQDGSSLFAFAFDIKRVLGDVVDQQNAAVAWSKCTSCQTTAIAIQIVLVEGTPSTVAPENVAVAVNESCTLCDTFATAFQFVVRSDGPMRFTRAGMRELWRVRHEIDSWQERKLTNEQIRALLPAVIDRIKAVLANELRPVRRGDEPQRDEHSSTRKHDAQPNAPPTTATTGTDTLQTTTTMPADTTSTDTTPTETTPTTTDGTTTTAPTTTTGPTTTAPATTTTTTP